MRTKEEIAYQLDELLDGTDFYAVDIQVSRSGVIQVFIDHPGVVTLDDCVRIHRSLEEKLDREAEDYELQVSSAGLDQPLKDVRQFEKRTGEILRIWTSDSRQIRGKLIAVRKADTDGGTEIEIQPVANKKNTAPDHVVVKLNEIRIAKIELKF